MGKELMEKMIKERNELEGVNEKIMNEKVVDGIHMNERGM